MTLGEWIMDIAEIIVGLIAGASLISFFVERNKLGSVEDDLKDDHKNVFKMASTEHDKLSAEIKVISTEHSGLKEQQTEIKTMLSFLKDEKNKELGRISEQRSSQLDIEKIINQLTALSVEVSDLRIENASLKNENTGLRKYIAQFHSNASSADTEEFEM